MNTQIFTEFLKTKETQLTTRQDRQNVWWQEDNRNYDWHLAVFPQLHEQTFSVLVVNNTVA